MPKKFKRLFKYLILGILITFLVIPKPALAFIGTGIFDYFNAAVNGLGSMFTNPIVGEIVKMLTRYISSFIFCWGSAGVLEWVIGWPVPINAGNNQMVTAGFNFVSGVANMVLVLMFIFSAFLIILKVETFQAKKTIPKLVIAALLLNFGRVFVGMIVDISQILFNSILGASGSGFITQVLNSAFLGLTGTITSILAILATLAILSAIPFTAPFAILAMILMSAIFLPNFVIWQLQTLCGFLIGGVLLFISAILIARVFILQFLAIISPIGIVCLAFPSTRKYGKMWLENLVGWAFAGIFFIFMLVLGFKVTTNLLPAPWSGALPIVAWANIRGYIIYYITLVVYLGVTVFIGKATIPKAAQAIIAGATALGGMVWASGIKPMGKAVGAQANRSAAEQKRAEERAKAEGKPLTGRQIAVKRAMAPIRFVQRLRRTTPEAQVSGDIEARAAEFEKKYGKDTETAMATGIPSWRIADPHAKAAMALYVAKMKGAKGLAKLGKDKTREAARILATSSPSRLVDLVKHDPTLIDDPEVGGIVQSAMVSKGLAQDASGGYEDEDVQKLIDIGVAPAEAIRQAAFKKAVDALKVEDIESLSEETLSNTNFQEMVVRFKSSNFIQKIGERGGLFTDQIYETMKRLTPKEIAKTNPTLLTRSLSDPGFRSICPPLPGCDTRGKIEMLKIIAGDRTGVLGQLFEADENVRKLEENLASARSQGLPTADITAAEDALNTGELTRNGMLTNVQANTALNAKWQAIEVLRRGGRGGGGTPPPPTGPGAGGTPPPPTGPGPGGTPPPPPPPPPAAGGGGAGGGLGRPGGETPPAGGKKTFKTQADKDAAIDEMSKRDLYDLDELSELENAEVEQKPGPGGHRHRHRHRRQQQQEEVKQQQNK